MSVYLYDEALTTRIRTVINDNTVSVIPFEKVFTKQADAQDNPPMPIVSIYRHGYSLTNNGTRNIVGYREGRVNDIPIITNNVESKLRVNQQYIPITIRYQIDVWTRTRQQNDEYVRELIWFFMLYPENVITLTYGDYEQKIKFNTFLEDDVTDNSEINEFENRGQYYRSTFNVYVDEAQLFYIVVNNQVNSFTYIVDSYTAEGVKFDSEQGSVIYSD